MEVVPLRAMTPGMLDRTATLMASLEAATAGNQS